MIQIIKYSPDVDIAEVDQFGFVDINQSMRNGYVPGNNASVTLDFDGEDVDPSAIIGKPSDAFEAMRMQDSMMKSLKSANYSKSESVGSSYKKDEK